MRAKLSAMAVTLGLAVAIMGGPADRAAAIELGVPDLRISAQVGPIVIGVNAATYPVTVTNPTERIFDPEWRQYRMVGANTSGVTVRGQLRDFLVGSVTSVTGDSGFQCSISGRQFTCVNGSIKAGASAKITVKVAPEVSILDLVVDPANAIYERSETNNSTTVGTWSPG
jgi:hypothetical protein